MKSDLTAFVDLAADVPDCSVHKPNIEKVIEFYGEATIDYGHWSDGFNMHLGFYRWGINPFNREKMLEQSNIEIAKRLEIDSKVETFLVDLGCGTGAIARTVAKKYKNSIVKGVTISPSQVQLASGLNAADNLSTQIEVFEGDFTSLPFDAGSADGVWAVESACYAKGSAKKDLISEMARVLKNGGRFAVADCFIKEPDKPFNFVIDKCYSSVCRNWALEEMPVIDKFVDELGRQGFQDIVVEDISWRVAPSLAHAPFAVLSFLVKKLLSGDSINVQSINNLKASLLAIALGLNRKKFSYFLVSGRNGTGVK